jgi:hypothetical protein
MFKIVFSPICIEQFPLEMRAKLHLGCYYYYYSFLKDESINFTESLKYKSIKILSAVLELFNVEGGTYMMNLTGEFLKFFFWNSSKMRLDRFCYKSLIL